MAKQVIFVPPDGLDIEDPSLQEIRLLIFERGADYWCGECGTAGFFYRDGELEAQLVLVFCENHGFHLTYITIDEQKVLRKDNKRADVLEVYVGGEPTNLPINEFADLETTWSAVRVFIASGKMNEKLNWVEQSYVDG